MEFRILGPLEVLDGGRPVEIAGSKRRALLALLLLHADEVVRTERLIDELWGEEVPQNAQAALHNHVSRLRKALGGDVLVRREWGYVLRAPPRSIDLHAFERLVADAEPLPAQGRSAKLAEALALWRGPPLADLACEPGLRNEIARLEDLRLSTLEHRIDADLEAGRSAELIPEIETLIAGEPLREHLRAQLILALYRADRQAEALEVYRETRRLLSDELGLEPSPALRELERAILRHDPAIAGARPVTAVTRQPGRSAFSKRSAVLLGVLALGLTGAGLGVALALTGLGARHAGVQAASAAAAATHAQAPATTVTVPASGTTHAGAGRSPTRTRPAVASTRRRSVVAGRPSTRAGHIARRPRPVDAASAAPRPARGATTTASTEPRTTHTKRHKPSSPKPRLVTISDDFSGDQIDPTIWYQVGPGGSNPGGGSGWTISQSDGRLEFAFPPGTAPGGPWHVYGGHVGTQCVFPGDFDAQVDFDLARWPAANGIFASLWLWFKPDNLGWEAWRASSPQAGDQYGAYLGVGHGGGVSLDDPVGTLRVRRRSGLVTAYYLHRGQWLSLGSATNTHPAVIAVGAGSGPNPPVRADQVTVDFDNFTVTGTDPSCPPGTQGSA